MSLRQVYFATLDLMLHSEYQPGKGDSVFRSAVVQRVIDENTVMPPLPEDRFLNGFQHIFAGGYSAGDSPVSHHCLESRHSDTLEWGLKHLDAPHLLFSCLLCSNEASSLCYAS